MSMIGFTGHRFEKDIIAGLREWEAKVRIVRDAVRAYLASPRHILTSTANSQASYA